ncbi:MAG: hypothetical protein WCO55_04555 [Candidatus Falkowbacteria bacterium]
MIPLAELTQRERDITRLNDLKYSYDDLSYIYTEPDEQFTYQFLENLSESIIKLSHKITDLMKAVPAESHKINPNGELIDVDPMPQLAEYLYSGKIFNERFHAVTNNEDTNQTLLRQLEDVLKPFRDFLSLGKSETIYLFPDGAYFSFLIMPDFPGWNEGGLHFTFFLEFEFKTLAVQALFDGPIEKLINHLEDRKLIRMIPDQVELTEVNTLYETLRAQYYQSSDTEIHEVKDKPRHKMEAEKLAQLQAKIDGATEVKCWQYIDALGGHIFKMEHDYADNLDGKDQELEDAIEQTKQLVELIVGMVCKKYKIIPIKDTPKTAAGESLPAAPAGQTYYWDWYRKLKAEALKES